MARRLAASAAGAALISLAPVLVKLAGDSGVGKTWLACALAHKACREGYTAEYIRLTRLLRELMIAKGDGRYPKLLANLAKVTGWDAIAP